MDIFEYNCVILKYLYHVKTAKQPNLSNLLLLFITVVVFSSLFSCETVDFQQHSDLTQSNNNGIEVIDGVLHHL